MSSSAGPHPAADPLVSAALEVLAALPSVRPSQPAPLPPALVDAARALAVAASTSDALPEATHLVDYLAASDEWAQGTVGAGKFTCAAAALALAAITDAVPGYVLEELAALNEQIRHTLGVLVDLDELPAQDLRFLAFAQAQLDLPTHERDSHG